MKCTFQVGDKVVCINDRPKHPTPEWDVGALTSGEIYTVSKLIVLPQWDRPAVQVAEILLRTSDGRPARLSGFDCLRFRKVNDQRLEIFRQILTKAPEEPVS